MMTERKNTLEYWRYVGREGKYRFWEGSQDTTEAPIYNVTINNSPPTNKAGYYRFDALLKLKNCSAARLDRTPLQKVEEK